VHAKVLARNQEAAAAVFRRRAGRLPADAQEPQSAQVGHRLQRGRVGGRPPTLDAEAYKQRNAVERRNRFKQWRGLALRTDKLAIAYQAALHLAAILIWARG
jgi:transposase